MTPAVDGERESDEATPESVVRECLRAGVDAVRPQAVIDATVHVRDGTLDVDPRTEDDQVAVGLDGYDEVLVLGGGKAAGPLAAALESEFGDRLSGGVVVTGTPAEADRVTVHEGDHPLPTARNVEATAEILDRARAASAETLVVAPITGGGSALLAAPAGPCTVEDLRTVTDELLAAGAAVTEINAVRTHLSRVKGGGLASAAAPADVVGLLLSDVVGDDPATIASGPTVAPSSTPADAMDVLDRYDVTVSDRIDDHLDQRLDDRSTASEDTSDATGTVCNTVVADNGTAIDAASRHARKLGYEPAVLSTRVHGEASEVAKTHVAIADECARSGRPVDPPVALVSGGETTVTVDGDGTGGPNLEFALSAALERDPEDLGTACVGSIDTDGRDGSTDAAGAVVTGETFAASDRDRAADALARNDALPPLRDADALVETGRTGTNVNDLRVVVVEREGEDEGEGDR